MSEINALIEKLKVATGPDRRIDGDIAEALKQVPAWCTKRHHTQPELWSDGGPGLRAKTWLAEKYTDSIDAALALVERVLPGVDWSIDRRDEGDPEEWFDVTVGASFVQHRSAPLAILLSLLLALSQEETK
jgi:hypothetical protein